MKKKTVKKILKGVALAFVVVVVISMFFVSYASTEKIKYGGTWSFDDAAGVLTVSGNVEMLQSDYGAPYAPWHESSENITSVIIEEGTTLIADNAFMFCGNLESITLPSSLKSIGKNAFEYCEKLKEVRISDLTAWCDVTFENELSHPLYYGGIIYVNDEPLTDLTFPQGKEKINFYTFMGCESLKSATIPEGIMYIGDYAFMNCINLESIKVPESVTSLGICTFQGCKKLKSIDIPENVRVINDGVFAGCESIESLVLPKELKSIGWYSFDGCKNLKSINIPEAVTTFDAGVFADCESLESIVLPDGLKHIGWTAFYNCKSLKSINIPTGVTYVSDDAFEGCDKLGDIEYSVVVEDYDGEEKTEISYDGRERFINERKVHYNSKNQLVEAGYMIKGACKVKKGATAVLGTAFDVGDITSVVLPDSVTFIDDSGFYSSEISYIHIPNSVEYIGEEAFNNTNLKTIAIPPSVKEIGHKAIGYVFSSSEDILARDIKVQGFTIRGAKGSAVESYARENGFEFIVCSQDELNETCSCLCHKTGILKLLWKTDSLLMKLFELGENCKCGAVHYSD